MNITVGAGDYLTHACPALIVGCYEDRASDDRVVALDSALAGAIALLVNDREFVGKLNKVKLIHTCGRLPAERILLVGLGRKETLTIELLRRRRHCRQNFERCWTDALHLHTPPICRFSCRSRERDGRRPHAGRV